MPEDVLEKPEQETLTRSEEAVLGPTAEEIGVLYPIERTGFKLARAMNFGRW